MRLLHIDNDEIFSAKIKKIVEDNDVVYISADSYEKAGEIITEIKVDLVIITEQMDGVSCKAFIEKLTGQTAMFSRSQPRLKTLRAGGKAGR